MIYVLGDSFCWGYNFVVTKRPDRKELLFSHLLASKLNQNYKNYSIVGSSNYRIARLLNWLDIKKDDIVIIGWSGLDRLEIGVPKDRIMPNDVVVNVNNVDSFDGTKENSFQIIEKTDNYYTRQIYPLMETHFDDITSPSCKRFVQAYYSYASDKIYHEQMFKKVLLKPTVDMLRTVGCKFLMFTTWDVMFTDTKHLDYPEYLLHDTNMLDEVRYKNSKLKHVRKGDYFYWTPEEHHKVTDILYNALKEKYDIQ